MAEEKEEKIEVTEEELTYEKEYIESLEDELKNIRARWSEESDRIVFKERRLRSYELELKRLPRIISDLWRIQKWHVRRAEFLKRYAESLRRRLPEAPRLAPLVRYWEGLARIEQGEAERLEKSARRREYDYELTKRTINELKLAIEEERRIVGELYKRIRELIAEIDYEKERLKKKVVVPKYWKSLVVCSMVYKKEGEAPETRFEIHEIIPSIKEPDFTKGDDFKLATDLQYQLMMLYSAEGAGIMDALISMSEFQMGLVTTKRVKKFYDETKAIIIEHCIRKGWVYTVVRRSATIKWEVVRTLEGELIRRYTDIILHYEPIEPEELKREFDAEE